MAWPVRYKLVGLLTAGSTINYADRVNISVTACQMMPTLGLTEHQWARYIPLYLAGYTLCQIPGGQRGAGEKVYFLSYRISRWKSRKAGLLSIFCAFSIQGCDSGTSQVPINRQ